MTPDPMTPEFSRTLAELQFSPFFQGTGGAERWDSFIEQAAEYATAANLPDDLRATYQEAEKQLHLRRQTRS